MGTPARDACLHRPASPALLAFLHHRSFPVHVLYLFHGTFLTRRCKGWLLINPRVPLVQSNRFPHIGKGRLFRKPFSNFINSVCRVIISKLRWESQSVVKRKLSYSFGFYGNACFRMQQNTEYLHVRLPCGRKPNFKGGPFPSSHKIKTTLHSFKFVALFR